MNSPVSQIVICPSCGSKMNRLQGIYYEFYGCPNYKLGPEDPNYCDDCIPLHPDGRLYSREEQTEIREARKRAHETFDKLWKIEHSHHERNGFVRRTMTQSQAYKWLRKKLRLTRDECHIGRFGVEQCEEVIRISQDFLIQIQLGKVDAKRHYNNIANYVRES